MVDWHYWHFHIKVLNTVAFLALLVTAIAVGAFEHYQRISDAGFSFALNVLLYALLMGLSVYKWTPWGPKDAVSEALGLWYPTVSTMGIISYILWYFDKIIAAEIFSIFGFGALFVIYIKLKNYPPRNTADFLFLNAPFSIWVALSAYTVLFSLAEILFKSKGDRVPAPISITMLGIVVAGLAVYFLQVHDDKDWVYATTTACILFLLALNDLDGPLVNVHRITVFVLCSYLVFAVIWFWTPRTAAWMGKRVEPESQPLIVDHAGSVV